MPMPGLNSAQAVWTDSGDDEGSITPRSRAFSLVSRSSDGVPSHSSFSPSSSASSSDEESDAGTKDGRHHLSKDELADYKSMLRDLDRQEAVHRVTRAGPSNATSISTMGRMNDRRDPTSRSGRDQDSRDLDDRWPLLPDELDEASLPLGDIVKAVAREMTSGRHLSLQMPPPCPDNVTEDNQVESSEIDLELEGEGTPLPSDLAESTRALVDKLLVNLAAMRPKLSRKKRKRQPPISWEGVIQAGMLLDGHEESVLNAHKRMEALLTRRGLDTVEGDPKESMRAEAMQARLAYLEKKRSSRINVSLDDLYAPVLPQPRKPKRSHLGKAELKTREEKRAARLAKKEAKLAAKNTSV